MIHNVFLPSNPVPLHRMQGSPSDALPVPKHLLQIFSPVKELCPFPPQTIHVTLAPSGFFPVPEQKTHFLKGCSISMVPVPLHTRQKDIGPSNSKKSFPFPLQYGHVIFVPIDFQIIVWAWENINFQL
jgi:hypothetical protein